MTITLYTILYHCGLPDDGTLRAETCSSWWFMMLL